MDGHVALVLESIVDYWKNEVAIEKKDQYFYTSTGRCKLQQTTKGWQLCALWRTGEEQWAPLKVLKHSNPVEVADYAQANGLMDGPAFKW